MVDYGPELRRKLREAGCFYRRQAKGDHELWHSPISKKSFPVDGKIKSRPSANEVLKQAGLPKAF